MGVSYAAAQPAVQYVDQSGQPCNPFGQPLSTGAPQGHTFAPAEVAGLGANIEPVASVMNQTANTAVAPPTSTAVVAPVSTNSESAKKSSKKSSKKKLSSKKKEKGCC